MKKALSFFIIFLSYNTTSMAILQGCWLQENYVLAIANRSSEYVDFLKPIECIVVKDNAILLKCYGSESGFAQTRKDNGRIEIINLESLVNSMYVEAEDIRNRRYYLSNVGDALMLTIESLEKKIQVKFINKHNGFLFKEYYDTVLRLKLNGRFQYGPDGEKICFLLNGKIEDRQWSRYEITRDYPVVAADRVFWLIRLIGDNDQNDFAIHFSSMDTISFYDYSWESVDLRVSKEPRIVIKVSD